MTVYTADHRTITACSCVHRRLREADKLLTEARQHVQEATAELEKPVGDGCRAAELLNLAGQKRASAAEEVREALFALDYPPVPLATPCPDPAS